VDRRSATRRHRAGRVAHTLETEIKRVSGTRDVYTIGAPERVVAVTLDPTRLGAYGLTVSDLSQALQAANAVRQVGERVGAQGASRSRRASSWSTPMRSPTS